MGIRSVNGVIIDVDSSVNGVQVDPVNGKGINVDGIQITICYDYSIININRPPSSITVNYTNCAGSSDSVVSVAGGAPNIVCARYGTVSKPDPNIIATQGPRCS
jgi:hypothetical protein